MQVILLEKISNVGSLGDLVDVKPGFARNFLLPLGKAQMATKTNLEEFETRRAEYEAQQSSLLESAKQRAAALEGATVTVLARAGNEGKLFGSVGGDEIAAAFVRQTKLLKNVNCDCLKARCEIPVSTKSCFTFTLK